MKHCFLTFLLAIAALSVCACKGNSAWPGEENIPQAVRDSIEKAYAVTQTQVDSACYILALQFGQQVKGHNVTLNDDWFKKGLEEYSQSKGNKFSDKFQSQFSIDLKKGTRLMSQITSGMMHDVSGKQSDTVSYMLGASIGRMVKMCLIREYNADEFLAGIKDFLKAEGNPEEESFSRQLRINPMDTDSFTDIFINYNMMGYAAALNTVREKYYLEAMEKDGFSKTSGGVLYKILKPGASRHITMDDCVAVHYTGYTPSGVEFDGNEGEEPASFYLDRIIEGWQETLPLIRKGGEIEIVIPSEKAYGEMGEMEGGIEPNMPLHFKIKVEDVIGF